jgi:hypothetical protein
VGLVNKLNQPGNNQYTAHKSRNVCCPDIAILKVLKSDVISFSSRNKETNEQDVYKKVNSLAEKYFQKLKQDLQAGLDYLKQIIPSLQVSFEALKSGAGGLAEIIPGDKNSVAYKMTINTDTNDPFGAVLHEGYHLIQFDNLDNAEFVKIRKLIARNEPAISKFKEKYEALTSIVVGDIVLPVFSKTMEKVVKDIQKAMNSGDQRKINDILDGKVLSDNHNLLPGSLKEWFRSLPDTRSIEYIRSHAIIEIEAHSFCLEKDPTPVIYNRNDINRNKLRDFIAIKIYKELSNLASEELESRKNSQNTPQFMGFAREKTG